MEKIDETMLKIAEWTKLIQAANESSMSRKEWCKANDISLSAFYYWQKKVRHLALETMTDRGTANPLQEKPDLFEISLQTIEAINEDTAVCPSDPHAVGRNTGLITIRSGRFEIDVNDSFSPKTLKSILEIIKYV